MYIYFLCPFCSIEEEAFPIWAYLAIGGGVLFVVMIATVVILCRGRRSKKAQGKFISPGPGCSKAD